MMTSLTFMEDDGNGDGTHDIDNISQGSEDDEVDLASMDKNEYTSGPSTQDDVVEDEYRSGPSVEDDSDSCEVGFLRSFGVLADGSLRMEFNDLELRQFKAIHMQISWTLVWFTRQYVTQV